jgi:molybdopterin molybdotransferase
MLAQLGAKTSDLGILPDKEKILAEKIGKAAKIHDLVLTTGGVSTGEADHVKAAVEKLGKLVFWRIAIKPGRPVAMGVIKGAAFAGLPGNPVAAFVTFAHIVRPLLLRLMGANTEPFTALPVRAGFDYKKKKDRREYVRVSLKRSSDGSFEAFKHPQEGAGVITSLTETDGFAELREDVTVVKKGDTFGFISYAALID